METNDFDEHIRNWAASACEEWKYPSPSDSWYKKVYSRLPNGLRRIIAQGVTEGCIIPIGPKFTLAGIKGGKGPYAWFSRSPSKALAPNWEYFVQAAEYCRLRSIATEKGLTVTFEDGLMDIAVYADNSLLICCEIKEKASELKKLVTGIKGYQGGVDFSEPDRGNDALRKAKYLIKHRPKYFSAIAIGMRFEFTVSYEGKRQFMLHEDIIPLTQSP